uniref:Uncharacterized protein n=1 Tax=Caenorhabditis japonica TaxID=281687 RepID=A0A8R1J396_CAEJA
MFLIPYSPSRKQSLKGAGEETMEDVMWTRLMQEWIRCPESDKLEDYNEKRKANDSKAYRQGPNRSVQTL